ADGVRPRRRPRPDPREEDQRDEGHAAAARAGRARRQAAPHHRRRGRGRGAGHARRQQAAWHADDLRREGAGLRRPPEGDARGYRGTDRRQGHHRGPRHQAREHQAGRPRPRQEGRDRQGQLDDRRRRRQGEGDRGAYQADPRPDRGDDVGLRPREAAGAPGQAGGRGGGDQGRRGHRDGDEGGEGAGGGGGGSDPGGGGRGHRAGRRGGAAAGVSGSGWAQARGRREVGAQIVRRALEEPIRNIVENAGLEGSVIVEKVKAEKVATRGFDAETLEYVDMLQAGIIDPTKVERVALQNAASVAALLLTTEALVTDLPEEKPAAAPPMPHGDMY